MPATMHHTDHETKKMEMPMEHPRSYRIIHQGGVMTDEDREVLWLAARLRCKNENGDFVCRSRASAHAKARTTLQKERANG